MRKLVGLGVLAVLCVACVDELAEGAGEVLVDAGEFLKDAGNDAAQALTDAGQHLPKVETLEVACDQSWTRVTRSRRQDTTDPTMLRDTVRQTTKNFYADFGPADPSAFVEAWVCDFESSEVEEPCTGSKLLCIETLGTQPKVSCQQAIVQVVGDRMRVSCGIEMRTLSHGSNGESLPESVGVARWKTARLVTHR